MSKEPVYVQQVVQNTALHQSWLQKQVRESRALGCVFARATYKEDDAKSLLFEAWDERPDDQGPARWHLDNVRPHPDN